MVISLLKKLRKPDYEPLNRIEIIAANLIGNFRYLSSIQPQATIIPVLKSNAYGHGLAPVCRILEKAGAKIVAVDSFPEAQIASRYFSGRILILGEMPEKAYRYARSSRLEFCVYNADTLRAIARYRPGAAVHLFSNTGMNREGIQDMEAFIDQNREALSQLKVRGLCSHLAAAEELDSPITARQRDKFFKDLQILQAHGLEPDTVHLGNSAGIFAFDDPRLTAFRAGLAFYGYSPFEAGHPQTSRVGKLKPALRLVSKIVSVQDLLPGDPVSYNGRFVAKVAGRSAVIPFGYYEGLDRSLSNQAVLRMKEGGEAVPIAGNVCMNLCCLDIGQKEVEIGEEVEVISAEKEATNSIDNLSKISKKIPYETLVALRDNIRREVIWP